MIETRGLTKRFGSFLAVDGVNLTVQPGEIAAQIAAAPPEQAEAFEDVFADFERIIAPGMTNWQHPRFFAYFAANAAPPSVVAEYLVKAIPAVCMLWQTSPAATATGTFSFPCSETSWPAGRRTTGACSWRRTAGRARRVRSRRP